MKKNKLYLPQGANLLRLFPTPTLLLLVIYIVCATSINAAIDANKSFVPATLYPTEISKLTVTLQNSSLSPSTNVSFSDVFPDEVFVASPANTSTTCGGTVTATNNTLGGEFSLSNGTIPAGDGTNPGVCTVTVDVFSDKKGTYTNRIEAGAVTATTNGATESNSQATEATLAIILQDLTGTINYALENTNYGNVQGGETNRTIITLTNPNPIPLTGVSFTNDLYDTAYNVRAIDGTQSTTCGSGTTTITAQPARFVTFGPTSKIEFANGTIPANGSCTISYDIVPSKSTTDPRYSTTRYNAILENNIQTNEGSTNISEIRKLIYSGTGVSIRKYFDNLVDKEINLLSTNTSVLRVRFYTYNTFSNGLDFTDDLPSGMTATSIKSNTCGGTLTNNTTSISITGGTLPAATANTTGLSTGYCDISFNVEVNSVGTYTNTIPAGSTDGYDYNGSISTLTATADALLITKNFQGSYFYQGDENDLVYTFSNNSDATTGIDVNNLDLTDVFESRCGSTAYCPSTDFKVSDSSPPISTCSGAVITAPAGAKTVTINDVTIPKGTTCTIRIPVVTAANVYPIGYHYDSIPVGDITYQIDGGTTVHDYPLIPESTAYVSPALRISKQFTPDVVSSGGITRLRITPIHYSYTRFGVEDIQFTDNLPAGHTVASQPNLVNECGGTVTAVPGSSVVSLTGGTLPAFFSTSSRRCNVYVDIQTPPLSGSTPETVTNTILRDAHDSPTPNYSGKKIGETGSEAKMENYSDAQDSLTRIPSALTVNKEFLPVSINGGGVSRVRVTISNISSSAINLTQVGLTDDFSSSDIRLYTNIDPTFTDITGSNQGGCRFGIISGNSGDSNITLSGAEVDAGALCQFEFNVTAYKGGNHINTINVGDLTSFEGVTNDQSASATLTVGRQVNIGKGFSPSIIATGENSTLTLDFFNTNVAPNNETGATPALIDEMPAGLDVVSIDSNTCGGTVSIGTQNGNDTVRIEGGTFPAESICQVKATVTASATGEYLNRIEVGDFSTLSGASNPDPAIAKLTVVQQPTITKAFETSTIKQNDESVVRFTINNPNSATLLNSGLTGIKFTDTLTNMVVASPPNVGGTCTNISYNGVVGSNTFEVTNATVPPNQSCTITFEVTSSVPGIHDNQVPGIATDQTTMLSAPSNNTSLTVLEPVTLTKEFEIDHNSINAPTKLTFTITNPNAQAVPLNNPGFVDTFPTTPGIMKIAPTPEFTNTCGSNLKNLADTQDAAAGDLGLRVEGGTIPANSSCTISFNVVADTVGTYTNTTTTIESNGGTGAAASDTITFNNHPPFSCSNEFYFSDSTSSIDPSQFSQVNFGSSISLSLLGDKSHGVKYDAIGLRKQDNYIYGISSTNDLIRVSSTGAIDQMGVVTGLPLNITSGDFGSDGLLYVKPSGSNNTLYKIDVTVSPHTAVLISLSQAVDISDLAFNPVDGMIYALGAGKMVKIDPLNGQVTPFGKSIPFPDGGSHFFDGLGNFYTTSSSNGDLYIIDVNSGANSGAYTSIGSLSNSAGSDGAFCSSLTPPVTLADVIGFKSIKLTEDADGNEVPSAGDTIEYTIQYVNKGFGFVRDFQINDQLPNGLTITSAGAQSVSTIGSATTALPSAAYTGDGAGSTSDLLAANALLGGKGVVSVTIPATIDPGTTGDIENQAEGSSGDLPSSVFSDNAGKTDDLPSDLTTAPYNLLVPVSSVPQTINSTIDHTMFTLAGLPNLKLVKSCDIPADCETVMQTPGTDLNYRIEFINEGNIAAHGLIIVDPVPNDTDFKIGSASSDPGTSGVTFVIEFSNDFDPTNPNAATWTYTPVDGGGGADTGYDRNVKAVRWRATAGSVSGTNPDNVGNVGFIAKIR